MFIGDFFLYQPLYESILVMRLAIYPYVFLFVLHSRLFDRLEFSFFGFPFLVKRARRFLECLSILGNLRTFYNFVLDSLAGMNCVQKPEFVQDYILQSRVIYLNCYKFR